MLDDPEGLGLAGGQPEARLRHTRDPGQPLAQALELGLPVGILADEAMRLQIARGRSFSGKRCAEGGSAPPKSTGMTLRPTGFQAAL